MVLGPTETALELYDPSYAERNLRHGYKYLRHDRKVTERFNSQVSLMTVSVIYISADSNKKEQPR